MGRRWFKSTQSWTGSFHPRAESGLTLETEVQTEIFQSGPEMETPGLQRMKPDTANAHCPALPWAPAPDQNPPAPPAAPKSLAYRANFLVAIPRTPFSSQPNSRKSSESHFRAVQNPGAAEEAATAAAAAAAPFFPLSHFSFGVFGVRGSGGRREWFGGEVSLLFYNGRRRCLCSWATVGEPLENRLESFLQRGR